MQGIRALTFDTGGTLLDWHSGFRDALVHRLYEWGGGAPQVGSVPDPGKYDIVAEDFLDLAGQLGRELA